MMATENEDELAEIADGVPTPSKTTVAHERHSREDVGHLEEDQAYSEPFWDDE